MRSIEEYLGLNYRASVYKDEDGDFVVEVDDLPGCVTHGATLAEAFENLEDAKRAWMESRLAGGLEIPEPKQRNKYSGKVLLRMPRSLHRVLAGQAEQEGVSLNQYIISLLSMGSVWAQGTAVNTWAAAASVCTHLTNRPRQTLGNLLLARQDIVSSNLGWGWNCNYLQFVDANYLGEPEMPFPRDITTGQRVLPKGA